MRTMANKYGPGQPPGPYRCWNVPHCLCLRRGGDGCVSKPRPGRTLVSQTHSGGGGSFAIRDRYDPAPAVIASASNSVLHSAGLARRPQRPGTRNAGTHSGYPSNSSPSRTAGKRRLFAIMAAPKTSHACTCGTLLEHAANRNKKFGPGCAEPVEDGNSLWKGKEKGEKTHRCELGG